MKKILFVAMLCASTALVAVNAGVAAVTSTPAAAPGAGGTVPSGGGGNFGGPGGGQGHERFEERKADVERRIRDHIAKMQERLSCVQAATNHEALKACLPEHGHGGGHGGFGGGHGGEHGGNGEEEPAPNSQ